jgi:hypothetical protein
MATYIPDTWVFLKISSDTGEYPTTNKVLGGWYGGYTSGDSWKMNSGITRVQDMGDYYEVHGHSGSIYNCYKQCEKLSGYTAQVLESFQIQFDTQATFEVVYFKDLEL